MTEQEKLEALVDEFAAEMKKKLLKKIDDGFNGWEAKDWDRYCLEKIFQKAHQLHDFRIRKVGDINQAVDLANFAMFFRYINS